MRNNSTLIIEQTRFDIESVESRDIQFVCAVLIGQKLRRHPKGWHAIVALGKCAREGGVDFQKWREAVNDDEGRALVDDLARAFAKTFAPAAHSDSHVLGGSQTPTDLM